MTHGFAHASGRGLGSNAQSKSTGDVNVRIGVWSTTEEEEESSNCKEFTNVADVI